MELRVLRYFLAVAREESISRAAQVLHISQPTLSRQLMDLEEQLQTKLLHRGSRNVTLTDEGQFFRKRVQEIIDLVDKTESEFLAPDDLLSGDIWIGCGETDTMRILAKAAKALHNDYPNIRFHLLSGNSEDVGERLDKGLLDFGVFLEPTDIKKYDYIRLPKKDRWGLLMRKDSPLAIKETIQAEDIRNIPIIASRQSLISNELSGWIHSSFEELNIVATYNLIYNAAKMVEEGMGYALTLDKLINTGHDTDLCFRCLDPFIESSLVVAWKKHHHFSKPSEAFLKYLRMILQEYI